MLTPCPSTFRPAFSSALSSKTRMAREDQRRGARHHGGGREKERGAAVHYSTDYVFDGAKTEPYLETDTPNPLSAYGRSKLAGDQAIQAMGGHRLIFRLCWVYGARGQNFLLTIMRLARERECLRIVSDRIGAPTPSRLIAQTTALALGR